MTSPAITSVSPTSGSAGVQVTISGAAFGSAQGTGSVWLGSIVCLGGQLDQYAGGGHGAVHREVRNRSVATGRNLVQWSALPGEYSRRLPALFPSNAFPGTQVTGITGSGFGGLQGSGQVWLGGAYGIRTKLEQYADRRRGGSRIGPRQRPSPGPGCQAEPSASGRSPAPVATRRP